MSFDEKLAQRVKRSLKGKRGLTEIKMFGGLCFMLRGNMACGIERNDLVVRIGKDKYRQALKDPNARPFDLTGRPLTGFVYVSQKGLKTPANLRKWVNAGVKYALSLPAKIT